MVTFSLPYLDDDWMMKSQHGVNPQVKKPCKVSQDLLHAQLLILLVGWMRYYMTMMMQKRWSEKRCLELLNVQLCR